MSLDTLRHIVFLLTIPLCLLTGYAATRVTLHFLEARQGWWNIALLFTAHYITMTSMVYIGDYWPPLLMAPGFIGAVCIFCKGRLLARFSMGMILVLLPLSLNALLTNVRPPYDFLMYVYIAVLWCSILLFVHRTLPKRTKPLIRSNRLWAFIDLLALMPFGSTITIIVLTEPIRTYTISDPFQDSRYVQNEQALLIILLLAAIAALGLLVSVVVMARHEKLEEEQVLSQMRSQYYLSLEQTQRQVRQLRHDMANHLTAMSSLDDAGMRSYLEELVTSPAMHSGRRYCEHEVVNAVLSGKVPIMEEAGIENVVELRIPAKLPIADMDLCTLFANGLDNAIEANMKLPQEHRFMHINAAAENGFLIVEIKNRASTEPHLENGGIVTSKHDKICHGFGLANIREIAERYEGVCKVEYTQSSFCLLVTVPI